MKESLRGRWGRADRPTGRSSTGQRDFLRRCEQPNPGSEMSLTPREPRAQGDTSKQDRQPCGMPRFPTPLAFRPFDRWLLTAGHHGPAKSELAK